MEKHFPDSGILSIVKEKIKILDRLTKSKAGNILFYILFGMIYSYRFFWTTMFPDIFFDVRFIRYPAYLAYGLILVLALVKTASLFFEDWKFGVFSGMVIVICGICMITTGEKEPIVISCLLIAGIGRNIKPALIISLISGSAFLLAAYYASMNGYIPYLVYDRGGEILAHAFGMIYRTDLAAHVLYLVMTYAILRAENLHLWEYLMLWFDTFLIWRYTGARMNALCLSLFLIAFGILCIYKMAKKTWPKIPVWTASVHIACFISIMLAIVLWPTNGQIKTIGDADASSFFSRINLSRTGFETYPVNLFGHIVEERGAGGIPDTSKPYFYLDVMYVRILLKYGIIVLILYLLIMTAASFRALLQKHAVLALALAIVAAASIIEHHAMDISYNTLILAGTGVFISKPPSVKVENIDSDGQHLANDGIKISEEIHR